MTLDESRAFIAQDRVIWPSATAKMNSTQKNGKVKEV